jgi:ABC-type lipoprotein release transport system permease subunit
MNVFVKQADLKKLLQLKSGYHELAVLLNAHDRAEPKALALQEKYPDLEVLSWMDLSLGMRMMVEMMDVYTLVLVGIILLALMFSIVNTMLMAVLERGKELGMLMAVGMTKQKVFSMIMLETICLTMLGGPLGLLLSWGSITYFGNHGIDLGASGDMYSDLGFASIIYPALEMKSYIQITIMVMVMAVLAAIYPARKALKLNPVEAIRKI